MKALPLLSSAGRGLALVFLASVLVAVAPAQTPALISHYTLDGNGVDLGSQGIDGALVGSAFYSAPGTGVGVFNQALSTADGTNDFFQATTASSLTLNALTIALWVNIDSASVDNIDRLVSNATESTGFEFTISKYTPGAGAGGADLFELSFGINSVSNRSSSADSSYISDKWLFLAVTYDGANIRFYSGDELTPLAHRSTAAKTGSIVASAEKLEIGGSPATPNDRSPVALFNDVRIYDGALSELELEAIRSGALIPEPAHFATVVGMISVVAMTATRRRRI